VVWGDGVQRDAFGCDEYPVRGHSGHISVDEDQVFWHCPPTFRGSSSPSGDGTVSIVERNGLQCPDMPVPP
jgi:hypothetical protein